MQEKKDESTRLDLNDLSRIKILSFFLNVCHSSGKGHRKDLKYCILTTGHEFKGLTQRNLTHHALHLKFVSFFVPVKEAVSGWAFKELTDRLYSCLSCNMMINAQFKGKFEIKGMSVENQRFSSYNLIRDLVFAHQHSIELYVECVMRTYLKTHVFFLTS